MVTIDHAAFERSKSTSETKRELVNESLQFLGRHTTLAQVVLRPKVWRRIPYLRENDGRAPPIVLAVGDRRRVVAIARKLRNPVLLPETVARLSNPHITTSHLPATVEFGRVALALGLAGSTPVLVVETQMGASATQIVLNEILSNELTSHEYKVGRRRIDLDRKVVVRLGTAGGMNCEGVSALKIGDVVNATHSLGATGAVMQSLLSLNCWNPDSYEAFQTRWSNLGSEFTVTAGGHPKVECSGEVIEAIDNAAAKLSSDWYHRGGNVTKDSLYAESCSDDFLELCRAENCRTTEMELSAIAVAARQHKTSFGMISTIVGLLPGSFAEDEKMKQVGERRVIELGLRTIQELV